MGISADGSIALIPIGVFVVSENAHLKISSGSLAAVICAAAGTVNVFAFLKRAAPTDFLDEKRLLTGAAQTDAH